jgi:RNA polymerase sigma-70 factor, ECF subfamily
LALSFAVLQSDLLISRNPCPLQEFMPLQACCADLQADWPLQEFTPWHFTFASSAALAVPAARLPIKSAAAVAIAAPPTLFVVFMRCLLWFASNVEPSASERPDGAANYYFPQSGMDSTAATAIIGAPMRDIPPDAPVSCPEGAPEGGTEASARASHLFGALRPELLRFAYWLSRDRSIAEDVVQEALLRAWRSRESLQDHAATRGWLLTIVRREHARLYERKRLETVDLHLAVANEDGALAGPADSERAELHAALLRLPDDYRVPLVMQVLGGFSTAEIAHELGLSLPAVLTRLFRARNRLRLIYGLEPAPESAGEPS